MQSDEALRCPQPSSSLVQGGLLLSQAAVSAQVAGNPVVPPLSELPHVRGSALLEASTLPLVSVAAPVTTHSATSAPNMSVPSLSHHVEAQRVNEGSVPPSFGR